jgi:hypothetical protein
VEFYVTGAPQDFKPHFAMLDRAMYVGLEYLDGTASEIFRNGESGLGRFRAYDPDTEDGLFETFGAIPNDYDNDIMMVLNGMGSETLRDWSRITGMTDAGGGTEIQLTHQFNLKNQDESTYSKYVILNSLKFTKITTSPAIADSIRDMCSAMGAIFVSFGVDDDVRRFRYKWDYTTPLVTQEWYEENFWADMLAHHVRAGNQWIWRIRAGVSLLTPSVEIFDWTNKDQVNDLTYNDDNEGFVGDTMHQINSFAIYGDDPHLWIMKENLPYEIVGNEAYEFRNSQMSSMVDSRNGRAAIQHDTFLYFGFHDGVARWHEGGDLANVGPNILGPAGLPWNRQGSAADFKGYGNLLFMAYDAGEEGYSSILVHNGQGWCELHRAEQIGQRILGMGIESMDGKPVDYLWFGQGGTLRRMPISTNPLALIGNDHYYYKFSTSGNTLRSSWISLGLKDIDKYVNKFKIVASKGMDFYGDASIPDPVFDENLGDGETYYKEGVYIGWRKNPKDAFTYYGDETQSPILMVGDWAVDAIVDDAAELFQYEVGIICENERYPIVLDSVVMDSVIRVPHKADINVTVRLRDNDVDLNRQPDPYPTAKEKYDYLETLIDQAAPCWVDLDAKYFVEGTRYFVDSKSLRIIRKMRDQNLDTWIVTFNLKEA